MKNLFELITRFPKITLIFLIVLTVFFGSQLPKLRMETDAESMIPQEHPAIIYNDQAKELFDIRDALIIGIVNEQPGGIFNPATLARVSRLTGQLASLDGIAAVTDDDVVSLATIDNIAGTDFGFEVSPFMEEIPTETAQAAALKIKFFENGIYVGGIVSEDSTTTAIYAELEEGLENRKKVYHQVKMLIDDELKSGGHDKIYIAGRPVLEVTFGDYMAEDMKKMIPIVIVVVLTLLMITFRSLGSVLLLFSVVIGSVVWAMGIMAFFNVPMFFISTQMPVILMAVGTAYGIHILNKYFQESQGNPKSEKRSIILATMNEMWKPVVMTALTTAVGFASLITAYMVPIRWFGVFTSIGVLAAMIFSLMMIPACLTIFRIKMRTFRNRNGTAEQNADITSLFGRMLHITGEIIYDNKKAVILATLVLALVAVFGLFRITTNSSWIEAIKHDSNVYIANHVLNEKLDGTMNLYVVVDGQTPDAFKSPELLQKIDEMQKDVEQMDLVGGSRSIAEYIKRMNRVMNEDRATFEIVPDTRDLVAQYLLMYSMSGDPGDFDDVVDYDYQQANIWMHINSDHTDDLAKVVRRVEKFTDAFLSYDNVKVNMAGRAYTSFVFVDLLVRSQMNSIIFSILAVFIITAVMFRSFVAGLFNIIPISTAMLLNFGLMGLFGLPLDVPTALSSGIVIGVGIDYTIHFLSKYRLEMGKESHRRKATLSTMTTTGRAIFYNALAVVAGFMVLYASNFPGNQQLGGLVSVNMLTCFLGAVTILPALLNIIQPKFISKNCKEDKHDDQ